jgi:signal transduction histidine kinase
MGIRARAILGVVVFGLLAALVVSALVIVDSQRSAREDIEQRFAERASASAALTASLFSSASQTSQGDNTRRYGRLRVADSVLERRAREAGNRYLLLLDADGTIIAASPSVSATVRREVASKPTYLRQTLAGRPYALSDVGSDGLPGPSMAFAQSFDTAHGRRVLVTGLDGRLIGQFLGGSLKDLPTVADGHTYLLDSRGAIVASPDPKMRVGTRVSEAGLLTALARDAQGDFAGGRHYAGAGVTGTSWRVVLTAPRKALFASVSGSSKWVPWLLLAGFGLAAFAAVALVGRVLRGAATVTFINARLNAANDALEEHAGQLSATNAELARSNDELERFASIASHDLREPLRKVQMFGERLIDVEASQMSSAGRGYVSRMTDAAARMETLIDGLLLYSRVSSQVRSPEQVDLTAIANEVVDDLQGVIAETGATVTVDPLPQVAGDPLQMRQLIQNLVSNALKFHREGVDPVVRVTGHADADAVQLIVIDNGIGLEERHTQRIFRVFERLHPRNAYPGTGMGLALCRRIAERHGGEITVQSTAGAGSTFTVTLPSSPTQPPTGQLAPETPAPEAHLVHE